MTGVSLRAETPADIPAITALINAAFANVTHSDQREAQIVDLLRQEDALVVSLVAERDGDLLGHVAASPVTLSDGSRRWFGIGPVSVLPDCQGEGIGSAMLVQLKDELRRLNVRRIDLGVHVRNQPAIGFYAKNGFLPVGEERLSCVV